MKYLWAVLQEHLEWNTNTNKLNIKLNKASYWPLFYVTIPKFLLRTLYYMHSFTLTRISDMPVKYGDKKNYGQKISTVTK